MPEPEGREVPDRRPCPTDTPCGAYWPGHHMHVIHANKVGETPWGWREAVVTDLSPDGPVSLTYDSGHTLQVWHHQDLTGEVMVAERVRVHEQWHAFTFGETVLNVVIEGGLGPVDEPADAAPWSPLMQVGIVNLGTGRGLMLEPFYTEADSSLRHEDDEASG